MVGELMSVAEWKEESGRKLRRWRVSFSPGEMHIECIVRRMGGRGDGERWKYEVDDVVGPQDIQSVKLRDTSSDEYTRAIFPDDYHLFLKYRRPSRGGSVKHDWPLRLIDHQDLLVLLEGLEEMLESPDSRVPRKQLSFLKSYIPQQQKFVEAQRSRDELYAGVLNSITGIAVRYGMDELERDMSRVEAQKPRVRGIVWILGFCFAIFLVPAVMVPLGSVLRRVLPWYSSHLWNLLMFAVMVACFLLMYFGLKKLNEHNGEVDGQRVFLCSDGLVYLVDFTERRLSSSSNSKKRRGVSCWYTEGCGEPLRITRFDGYKVKKKCIVLSGSFSEGEMDAINKNYVPVGNGKGKAKIKIWRIYSDMDEQRLLEKLGMMAPAGPGPYSGSSNSDGPIVS